MLYRSILFSLSSPFNHPLSPITCLHMSSLSLSILLPSSLSVWGFQSSGWKTSDQWSALCYRSTGDTLTDTLQHLTDAHTKSCLSFLLSRVNKFSVCLDRVSVCGVIKLTTKQTTAQSSSREEASSAQHAPCLLLLTSLDRNTCYQSQPVYLNMGLQLANKHRLLDTDNILIYSLPLDLIVTLNLSAAPTKTTLTATQSVWICPSLP